ncbi:hypothetical protein TVAG_192370 [Trichomonas vaginalis G3]|uniref:Uncharacterized protein n=1 Tax=Trichomonas vaginalis (strain ATCC PRA-98 / G3) TaxID=412133 RepID=A2DGV1_TRIV3|nr:tetratricopeptide repeat domain domain-containing protein [Trichomonas vaginalis G3]EAY20261.1 hypothetical protein TVAG_192370 [Trichomonas vaginalis G3]KAI5529133.1 tetratricopeptide repeat domain domain-containing protein [Trichomonas vaginalis G3]|eukprot:XP_001581247.1 hypothetical protein [Trichomonas vaginalis G3]
MSQQEYEQYTPTTKIESYETEYKTIVQQYRKFVQNPEINQSEWEKFLKSAQLPRPDLAVHGPLLGSEHDYPYYWLENDGIITIYISIPEDEPVEVTSKLIKSKAISGNFWDEVDIINFDRNRIMTTIKIQTHTHFPTIIRGGDSIDSLSSYFLGMLAISLNNIEYGIKWLTKAALDGCTTAPHFLGRFLITQKRTNEAIYWLANAVLLNIDQICMISLATLLIDEGLPFPHYELAENVLCDAASHGDNDAIGNLAKLYLVGGGPIKVDEVKGMKLMESLASSMGMDTNTIKVVRNTSEKIEQIQKSENQESPWVDIAISVGIVGAVIGAAYFGFKKFIKRA